LIEPDQVAQAYAEQDNLDTWGLDRIDQLDLPLDSRYVYPDSAGQGVDTYIIDTGIRDTHEDLRGNNDRTSAQIFNAVDDIDEDCNGHGTHVAGTAAGTLYGVAKKANMYGIKVLGCSGSGSFSGVVAGVNFVNSQVSPKTKVSNMSLGGGGSPCLDAAVNAGTDVLHVVATGNSNADACFYSPARAANAYGVNAADINDLKASFSNTGACSNIWAPGVDIKAPWHLTDFSYNTISGTSMAAPHVAGVAATILSDSPSLSNFELAAYLSGMAAVDKVSSTVLSGTPNLLLYNNRDDELPGQPPLPPAPTPSPCLCDNSCNWSFDDDCDDGGPGFDYSLCVLGSDCADCGNSYREEFAPGLDCPDYQCVPTELGGTYPDIDAEWCDSNCRAFGFPIGDLHEACDPESAVQLCTCD
jgi:serine protease